MNERMQKMMRYLNEKVVSPDSDSIASITEQLYQCYLHNSGIEPEEVRNKLEVVEGFLDRFTIREQSGMWDAVFDLCGEYEKQAFLDGFHTGLQLMMELWEREREEPSQTVSSNALHGMLQNTF